MTEQRARWIHPDEIQCGDEAKPEIFRRAWQSLFLKVDEYTFDRWLAVQTTDTYIDGDEDYKALSAKIASSGWSSLDKAEKATFSDRHLKAIRPEPVVETTAMTGWATMDGFAATTIAAFAVENDPRHQGISFNKDYSNAFRRVRVGLVSSSEDKLGSLSILDESYREISRHDPDNDMPDEDVLHAHVCMPMDRMKALIDEVAALPRRPTLHLTVRALLFQEESERIFMEPGEHRVYTMVYGHDTPLVLQSIRFERLSSKDDDIFKIG
jgi:hypothetical protein